MTPEQQQAQMAAYLAYTQDAIKSGLMDSGEALMPSFTGKVVRSKGGKAVATDGPFAETKEQLAGYYVLECKDEAQAIEWAAKISAIDGSTIEVRPVMVIGPSDPRG
jgi:hypothetical protein